MNAPGYWTAGYLNNVFYTRIFPTLFAFHFLVFQRFINNHSHSSKNAQNILTQGPRHALCLKHIAYKIHLLSDYIWQMLEK
jgi:hypothetical protein